MSLRLLLIGGVLWALVLGRFAYSATQNPPPPLTLTDKSPEKLDFSGLECGDGPTLASPHELISVCRGPGGRVLVRFEPASGRRTTLGSLGDAGDPVALARDGAAMILVATKASDGVWVHRFRAGVSTRLPSPVPDRPERLLALAAANGSPSLVFRRGSVSAEVIRYSWTGKRWAREEVNPFHCPAGTLCSTHGAYLSPGGWRYLLVSAPGDAWTGGAAMSHVSWVLAGGDGAKLGGGELSKDEFLGPPIHPTVGGVLIPPEGRIFELLPEALAEVTPPPERVRIDLVASPGPSRWWWERDRTRRILANGQPAVLSHVEGSGVRLRLGDGAPALIAPSDSPSSGAGPFRVLPAGPTAAHPTLAYWIVWPSGHAVALDGGLRRLGAPDFRARIRLSVAPFAASGRTLSARVTAASGPLLLFAFPPLLLLTGLAWLWQRFWKKDPDAIFRSGRLLTAYAVLLVLLAWPFWQQTAGF